MSIDSIALALGWYIPLRNRLTRHAIPFNHHLLLYDIRQHLRRILDGDQVRLPGTVPNHVQPVALSVSARLQPLVGRQLHKLPFARSRFDLDTPYLARNRIGAANIEAAAIMVLA